MERNGKMFFRAGVGAGLVMAAVLVLTAGSKNRDEGDTDAGCNLCEEMLVGSFSCALQSGEVLAQVNFKGSGTLTPSPTGEGILVLGAVSGGSASQCESLAKAVDNELDSANCEAGRLMNPTANQSVFDFVCRGKRASIVRAMGEIGKKVISLAP